MPASKLTALTANTDPLGSDLEYMVDDPGGTPASRKLYKGSNNLLPDGHMVNGKISVTVASNNITVALKTQSGGDPSATDPVSVRINGTYRRCTAALSVTKAAATNWFGSGSSAFATLEREYFVYLVWNTTPATDIMDLGFALIPFGRVYSDFSATTTNEKYLATANASAPTSTDDCVVIGRFSATLSGGAGYTWSVPTFTNANLIQYPIYSTNWLSYAPTPTGFSSVPTNVANRYRLIDNTCKLFVRHGTDGTSNATTFTIPLPFTARTVTNMSWGSVGVVIDSGTTQTTGGALRVLTGATVMDVFKDMSNAAFTASSGKRIANMSPMFYEI